MKVVNLFAGPGTGKSTTATGVFNELKNRGVNAEYSPEFAKDGAWEKRGPKFWAAQQYIYGKQSWRLARLKGDVDIAVTDCPLILGNVYMPEEFAIQSLRQTMLEDFNQYDNLNIFLTRTKIFNPKGRNQDLTEARALDDKIRQMLLDNNIPFHVLDTGRLAPFKIVDKMLAMGWSADVPALENNPSKEDLREILEYYYPQSIEPNYRDDTPGTGSVW